MSYPCHLVQTDRWSCVRPSADLALSCDWTIEAFILPGRLPGRVRILILAGKRLISSHQLLAKFHSRRWAQWLTNPGGQMSWIPEGGRIMRTLPVERMGKRADTSPG